MRFVGLVLEFCGVETRGRIAGASKACRDAVRRDTARRVRRRHGRESTSLRVLRRLDAWADHHPFDAPAPAPWIAVSGPARLDLRGWLEANGWGLPPLPRADAIDVQADDTGAWLLDTDRRLWSWSPVGRRLAFLRVRAFALPGADHLGRRCPCGLWAASAQRRPAVLDLEGRLRGSWCDRILVRLRVTRFALGPHFDVVMGVDGLVSCIHRSWALRGAPSEMPVMFHARGVVAMRIVHPWVYLLDEGGEVYRFDGTGGGGAFPEPVEGEVGWAWGMRQ